MKRTLAYRGETRRLRVASLDLSAENYRVMQFRFFAVLHMSISDHKNTTNIDLGLQGNFSEQANLQMQNASIMRLTVYTHISQKQMTNENSFICVR